MVGIWFFRIFEPQKYFEKGVLSEKSSFIYKNISKKSTFVGTRCPFLPFYVRILTSFLF
jgi:hypothetical protein